MNAPAPKELSMQAPALAGLLLRLRLVLFAAGPLRLGAAAVLLIATLTALWLWPQEARLAREHAAALAAARRLATSAPPAPPAPVQDDRNLTLFYQTLGDKRYAEQQVRILFGLAEKSGLTLSQGQYRSAQDKEARVDIYQITLPVKGSYAAIWQFSLQALRAIPFASLDDISFKRDAIGEAGVEARLRFTLYLWRGGRL